MVHDGTRVEVPTARQREVPRQLRKLVSGAQEWCTRVVHESGTSGAWRCTRGARDCGVVHEFSGARVGVVHEYEWCTRWVHEMGAREYVAVHE